MIIALSPMRHDEPMTLHRVGDVLTVNGTALDLSDPALESPWIVGTPERIDGVWHITLLLPHGANAPGEALYPLPVAVHDDGPIPLPAHSLPEEEPPAS